MKKDSPSQNGMNNKEIKRITNAIVKVFGENYRDYVLTFLVSAYLEGVTDILREQLKKQGVKTDQYEKTYL